MVITTPENISARYDAAIPGPPNLPPQVVFEVKTRHYWTNGENPPTPWLDTRALQFFQQAYVAARCNVDYEIVVDNEIGLRGLQNLFPDFPILPLP
jgi:hypothetical protein